MIHQLYVRVSTGSKPLPSDDGSFMYVEMYRVDAGHSKSTAYLRLLYHYPRVPVSDVSLDATDALSGTLRL